MNDNTIHPNHYFKMTIFSSLLLLLPFCIFRSSNGNLTRGKLVTGTEVSAVFAFGDSIMDTGNNNDIFTLVKSNFAPYGRDFDQGNATGRFGNGRILSDFLAEALGVKRLLPAYHDPNLHESDLLTGVCFASAGSGYDYFTSLSLLVNSMESQVTMFKEYRRKLKKIIGRKGTNFVLKNSVSFLAAGSNDIASYFNSPYRRVDYTFDSYTDFLTTSASTIIKKLRKLGARKIVVVNVPAIGCVPIQRTLGGRQGRECADKMNEVIQMFNSKLANELDNNLKHTLSDTKLVYVDYHHIMLNILHNASIYGFEVLDKGCCGSGLAETAILCNPFSTLCDNPSKYLFWDSYHPTEIAYQIISKKIVGRYLHELF